MLFLILKNYFTYFEISARYWSKHNPLMQPAGNGLSDGVFLCF